MRDNDIENGDGSRAPGERWRRRRPAPAGQRHPSTRITLALITGLIGGGACAWSAEADRLGPILLTQLPIETRAGGTRPGTPEVMQPEFGNGARIIMVMPDSSRIVLTGGFHSASDPRPSFDGKRMLFAGKENGPEDWDIYEMDLDTSSVRRITRNRGNCRSPVYQGTHYTIDSDKPWRQITFVSDHAGERNEHGSFPSTSLYSCKLDGTRVRRLTFNPSSDMDPTILNDGRLLFSSWQRSNLERGTFGRISLFAAQTDGLDYASFSGGQGRRIKLMPCITADDLVVFVESESLAWDGAGALASLSLARNLHSYRQIVDDREGLFHSPSPLQDGSVLVSRRPADGTGTHGVYRLDPETGRFEPIFDDPEYHDVQARLVAARHQPDGRSSPVSDSNANGRFYCLNVHDSDLPRHETIGAATPVRLRVLEGLPRSIDPAGSVSAGGQDVGVVDPNSLHENRSPLLETRFLGEIPIEEDGSFNIDVPANIPIQLQLIDTEGLALRSCGWIWVRNRETRGCIGCHEDGERTPENRFVQALHGPPIDLTLPPRKRRTVDFQRQVMPIISSKCSSASCHEDGGTPPLLTGGEGPAPRLGGESTLVLAYRNLLAGAGASASNGDSPFGRYVHAGRARTSPLIWHLFGRNTSRPWDGTYNDHPVRTIPTGASEPLTEHEKRTFVEWVDLGAHLTVLPDPENDRHEPGSDAPGGER